MYQSLKVGSNLLFVLALGGPATALAQNATHCLSLTETATGANAITNTCSQAVRYVFCGSDAGVNELVGVCGRDIGGSLLAPGQTTGLTQGRERVRYFYFGCTAPMRPVDVEWTGSSIRARCQR